MTDLRGVALGLLAMVFGGCSELGIDTTDEVPALRAFQVQGLEGPGSVTPQWGAARCEAKSASDFRWLGCATAGEGASAFLASAMALVPAVDVRNSTLRTWVRVDDPTRLAGLELRVASGAFTDGFAAFQMPLFDDGPFNMIQAGVWTPLSFSLATLRQEGVVDLGQIRRVGLYFADTGDGVLRLDWTGVRAVEKADKGYLSFTFDDGTKEHVTVAAPEMQRHGFRGTAYVMPNEVGVPRFVKPEDLVALRDVYDWDVAAHHGVPFTDFTAKTLESEILGVQRYLRNRGFDRGAGHLAYPLGRQTPAAVRPMVRKHFATARLAGAGPETIPVADPHLLRAVNVLRTTTPEELAEVAVRARDHGEWAILMFHVFTDEPKLDIEYHPETFAKAVDAIAATGVEVLPVSEVWEKIRGLQTREVAPPAARAD